MTGARRVSIIVPTRNERLTIAETLRALREPEVLEVIVVDAASEDGTAAAARPFADQLIDCAPGRGRQMNAGARAARGEILFFLHADTRVPSGFARAIVSAVDDPAVVGGRFDIDVEGDAPGLRVVAEAVNLRSRWTRLFTGDQGLFIRREAFERLGGFREMPIFEDLEMALAMRRAGRIACLRERLRTSGRRWQRRGVVRTVLLMWLLRALYFAGVAPERLARLYRDVR